MGMAGKKEKIELTERDIELLKCVAKFRIVPLNNARMFYDNAKTYHLKRLQKLREHKYLVKEGTGVKLGAKGAEYLKTIGIDTKPLRTSKPRVKERIKEIARTMIRPRVWEVFIPAWEIKGQKGEINRKNAMWGAVDGVAIYRLPRTVKKSGIATYVDDIKDACSNGFERILVLYSPDPQYRKIYDEFVEKPLKGPKSMYMIPLNDRGLELMEVILFEDRNRWVKGVLDEIYGAGKYTLVEDETRPYDATVEGKEVYVNIENCQKKYEYLQVMCELGRQDLLRVVCLDEQRRKYEELGIQPDTISWDKFREIINKTEGGNEQ